MRLLLVEDEPRMANLVSRGLRENSFAVDVATDGDQALYMAAITAYDLILLDVMLPTIDGYEVCKQIRGQSDSVPILMLTARNAVEDRVSGLDSGADDYLSKPFDFTELLARVRALLRRARDVRPQSLTVADLVLNTASHSVHRAGQNIRLTAKEYALLEFFVLRKGQLLGRQEIAEHVWDENFDPFSNVIDVYVKRLRRKIDDGFHPTLIHTRRGEGYIFTADQEEAGA